MLVLKIVLAAAFIVAGGAKLAGAEPLRVQFEEFGLPAWAMFTVGMLEVAGAVGLWPSVTSFWAALCLALLMLGAIANHLKAQHPFAKTAPACVLLVLSAFLATALWNTAL